MNQEEIWRILAEEARLEQASDKLLEIVTALNEKSEFHIVVCRTPKRSVPYVTNCQIKKVG